MKKKHLLITLKKNGEGEMLRYADVLEEGVRGIMATMGMDVKGVLSHQFLPWGATTIFLLSESHCSAHTFWEEDEVCIDLFCCRDFDVTKAVDLFKAAFGAKFVEARLVDRAEKLSFSHHVLDK